MSAPYPNTPLPISLRASRGSRAIIPEAGRMKRAYLSRMPPRIGEVFRKANPSPREERTEEAETPTLGFGRWSSGIRQRAAMTEM